MRCLAGLFSVKVLKIDVTEGDPESSAPDFQLLDVEDGWFLWGQHQHDVLAR